MIQADRELVYVVNVSGGLSSFEALKRTIGAHGVENTIPVFADTKGDSTEEYDGEDADLYRFLNDIERHFGITIIRIAEGRAVWDVLIDDRCITMVVGNKRVSPCSKKLKREVVDRWIETHYTPDQIVRVFGMKWTEMHRMESLRVACQPYQCWFPLSEPPFVDDCHIAAYLESVGIAVPKLYLNGFEHNNCGGFCINAGQAHFARLWQTDPDRYLYHEAQEAYFHEAIRDDVTILRVQRDGVKYPISLRDFRKHLQAGGKYDRLEWGGCGCFAPHAQSRMDNLILEADVKSTPFRSASTTHPASPVVPLEQ